MPPAFVLVHSPSVGPSTWTPVAERLSARGYPTRVPTLTSVATGTPPFWPHVVDAVLASLTDLPADQPVVLVAHSNAGLFVPVIRKALHHPVLACVFVDASLPARTGETPVAPPEFLSTLERLADSDGLLPPWTDWFDETDVAPMFPDEPTRHRITTEQPRLPLSFYQQKIPVPAAWDDRPTAYILFGPPYDAQAAEARTRGWPVHELPGAHLHQIVAPTPTTDLLLTTIAHP